MRKVIKSYTVGATKARAVNAFIKRFGYAPRNVYKAGSTWRAGPGKVVGDVGRTRPMG